MRTDPQNEDALEKLEYWRGLHREILGDDSTQHYGFFSVSHRLKRSVSIIKKLGIFSKMQLTRMQDIAGFRVVVDLSLSRFTFEEVVDELRRTFLEDAVQISRNFQQKDFYDYTAQPKTSGYRAKHIVFSFDTDIFSNVLHEFQFRTRLQHLWAMAVETVDAFYKQSLKAGQGDPGWDNFFRLASAAISHLENAPVVAEHAGKSFDEIRMELRRQGTELSYFTKLKAIKEVEEKYSVGEYDYWLLELNIKKGQTAIYGFKAEQIETAHEMYSAKERTPACVRGDTQVVLVSTRSFKDLRKAYPSYFLDVADFIALLNRIVDKPGA